MASAPETKAISRRLLLGFGIVLVLLLLLGTVFGGVHIPLAKAGTLVVTLTIGAIPFCALGLVIGLLVSFGDRQSYRRLRSH